MPDEKIERTDTGFSIELTMTRGTGTRDQEKLKAKAKGETLEDAKADMDEAKPWLKAFAEDVRGWQPEADDE